VPLDDDVVERAVRNLTGYGPLSPLLAGTGFSRSSARGRHPRQIGDDRSVTTTWLGGLRAKGARISKWVIPLLCPVLFAVFTLLSLFAQNQSEVELSLLWRPLAVCVMAALLLYGLFLAITKDRAKAGVLASLVVIAFFDYGMLFEHRSRWFIVLWLALLAVGVSTVLHTKRDLVNLTAVLVVIAAVQAVPPAVEIARYQADHPGVAAADPRLWPTVLDPPVVASGDPRPDIFVIIPDDYARADILEQYFHYDDTEFLDQLEQRGFTINDNGRSPYSDSEMNVAALLNMDYLTNFTDVLGTDSPDVRPVQRVNEDNRAARLLASVGYHYVHIDTDEVTYGGGNPSVSPFAPPDSFANLWMEKSILGQVGGRLGFDRSSMNDRFRNAIGEEFAELGAIRTGDQPKFVVFHTLLPHDPYLYSAQGEPVDHVVHTDLDTSSDAGRAQYLEQLDHLNGLLLDTIDQIQAGARTPPVIVLQADEGFQAEPEVFGEQAMQDIRVKGLSAFALPGLDQPGLPSPPNGVNALRFVFNRYLGTSYEMLDDRSYAEEDLPYEFSNEVPLR